MTEKIRQFRFQALAAALHGAKISTKDNPGVLLDVSFDQKGDLDRESFIVKVVGGKQQVVATVPPIGASRRRLTKAMCVPSVRGRRSRRQVGSPVSASKKKKAMTRTYTMAAVMPMLRLRRRARHVWPTSIIRSHTIDEIIRSRTIAKDVMTAALARRAVTLVSVSELTMYLLPTAVIVAAVTSVHGPGSVAGE
jgi:hypothetical protein